MNESERLTLVRTTIAEMQDYLGEIKATLESEEFPRTTFVVMSGELPLKFDVVKNVATNPQVCSLVLATRFSRFNARIVAAACKNGLSEGAVARTVEEAAYRKMAGLQTTIDRIRSANPAA
jgi:hypothetical protein